MGNVCRKVGKEGEAENRFQRLPDDVVLHILGKLSNVKWLCRCFVVEKRFASLIPLVQTVSIDTKTWNSFFSNQGRSGYLGVSCFNRIFSDLLIKNPTTEWIENLTQECALVYYLTQRFPRLMFCLKHIQYLHIELPSDYNANNDSVFKWGANFIRKPTSLTFLAAASLSKPDEEKDGKETENEIAWSELKRRVHLSLVCVDNAILWHATLGCAVKTCLKLRSITITDSKNKGVKVCLSGEKLVEYRKRSKIIASTGAPSGGIVWNGYVPVLQLPVSGYVMKGVTILHSNPLALDAFDGTAMLDDFAEEKGVFSEAVVQILEKHRSRIEAIDS